MDPSSGGPDQLTSYHVRRARAGDGSSCSWIVERFSPLLRASARYRLGRALRSQCDPEDLVQEVWAAALPRLPDIRERDGRFTPVLLRFLSSTLLNIVRGLARQRLREGPRPGAVKGGAPGGDAIDDVATPSTGVGTRLERRETRDLVGEALGRLDARDREILILRGVEGHAYAEIAVLLAGEAKSLAVRYARALEKLRRELPGSVYEELTTE